MFIPGVSEVKALTDPWTKGSFQLKQKWSQGNFSHLVVLVLWLRHLCPGGQFCRSITKKYCTSYFAQTWWQQLVVGGTVVKNLPASAGDVRDLGLIHGLGRSSGVWSSNPLSGGSDGKKSAFKAGHLGLIPGSGKSPGEGNGNPASILDWEIPWTEEPGLLQSLGSQSWTRLSTHTCKYTAENFSSPDPRNNQVNSLRATFQKHRIPTSPQMNKIIAKSIMS